MATKFKTRNQGVVILFAVLLVSTVLVISLTLLNITYRQLILSSIAKESEFAFYAADSARNCANYLDFSADHPFGSFTLNPAGNNWLLEQPENGREISCGDVPATTEVSHSDANRAQIHFTLFYDSESRHPCAVVSVMKTINPGQATNPQTEIEVRGYNVSSGATCPANSSRTVERGIRTVRQG